jgi:hypothetical protein
MDWHKAAVATRYGVVAFAIYDGDRWTEAQVSEAARVQAKFTVTLTLLESAYGYSVDESLACWHVVTADGDCIVEAY